MICQRCNATMIKRQDGTPYCYPCFAGASLHAAITTVTSDGAVTAPRTSVPPRGGLLASPPSAEAFRLLQERVAKLESAMADLKRRTEPQTPVAVRFLGQFAGEPSLGEPGEKR